MIRINLLPFRAARKKENVRRQVTIYGLSVVFLVLVMAYYLIQLNGQIASLKKEEADTQAKFRSYQATIRKINLLEKKTKEIKTKLKVIRELEKNKTGPVHLLDEIAMAVPKDKLWLTSLKESAGSLKLQGTAMDNETVALFMTNLEKSKYIGSVDLQSVRLRYLPKYKLRVSDFVLDCKTYAYKKEEKAPIKKRRRS